MKSNTFLSLTILLIIFCYNPVFAEKSRVKLRFTYEQDPEIYEESDYGEPPQVAIWLEDTVTGTTRTVYVTYRTAAGQFEGKIECPVSLPAWIGVYRREFGKQGFPTPRDPIPEAITKATSLVELVSAEVEVPLGSCWRYYIEMNVAADFNVHFPFETGSSRLDYQHNGQPSLVYRGIIVADPGCKSTPEPFGRTGQYQFDSEIINDLEGMDTALECFKSIEVECIVE